MTVCRTDRRTLLKGVLGAVAGIAWVGSASFAAQAARGVTRLDDSLFVLSGFGGNVVVRSSAEGLMLVDSGAAAFTESLLARLELLPDAGPVHTLFNTHWHPEQTGGNEALGLAGARIIAHENTRLWMATDRYDPAEDRYDPAYPRAAHPSETFYTEGSLLAGDERVDYGYLLKAHTNGDIFVFFRDANVLVAGDAVAPERDPELDWYAAGWLGGRAESMERLLEVSDADTRIVPGFGPVMSREQLEVEYEMTAYLYETVNELVRQGHSAQDMLEAGVLEGLGRSWDEPMKFLYAAYKGMWAHHNTLGPDVL